MSKAECWTCTEDAEVLENDIGEAIGCHLESMSVDHWPVRLTVYAYARNDPPSDSTRKWLAEVALERFFEHYDEDYGNPDGTDMSSELKTIAREFVDKVIANVGVWQCHRIKDEDETVVVADWVRENMPEWTTTPDVRAWVEAREAEQKQSAGG